MRPFALLAAPAVLVMAACAAPAAAPARTPARPASAAPASGPAAIQRLADAVNDHRRRIGCPPLAWLPAAAQAAQAHSDDMARRNYFDHVSPDGRGVVQRLQEAGVHIQRVAENIALTQGGPDDALRLWLGSPGHRENLENCAYTHHGLGERNVRLTHDFVTPAPAR